MTIETKRKIVSLLEDMCSYFHQSNVYIWIEGLLTGRHCNFATMSFKLDEKWDTGVWGDKTQTGCLS